MTSSPTLHLLCGKVASGKSTLAGRLAAAPGTVLLCEDALLAGLYGEDMRTLKDFVEYSGRLRRTIAPHIVALLQSGISVVLDFQANTLESRGWMRELIDAVGCDHRLHVLDTPDEVCKARLKSRNALGEHEFSVTEEQFDRISRHFQRPAEEEGFTLEIYREVS